MSVSFKCVLLCIFPLIDTYRSKASRGNMIQGEKEGRTKRRKAERPNKNRNPTICQLWHCYCWDLWWFQKLQGLLPFHKNTRMVFWRKISVVSTWLNSKGIKIWISLTANLSLTCPTFMKAKVELHVGINTHTCARAHAITHTHMDFLSLPSVCLQHPSCQRRPSAPSRNQILVLECDDIPGAGAGRHACYWWFMSSCQAAGRTKRSKCPHSQTSHTPKVLGKHTSFIVQCGMSKIATHSNWRAQACGEFLGLSSWQREEHETCSVVTQKKGLEMVGGVGRQVSEVHACVWLIPAQRSVKILALFLAITLKVLPEVLTAPPVLPAGFSLCSKSTNYFL